MSSVNLLNVTVNGNPAAFGASYEFEITFECIEALKNGMPSTLRIRLMQLRWGVDLEWKLTYVGSATS